jgi:hypothetical protein
MKKQFNAFAGGEIVQGQYVESFEHGVGIVQTATFKGEHYFDIVLLSGYQLRSVTEGTLRSTGEWVIHGDIATDGELAIAVGVMNMKNSDRGSSIFLNNFASPASQLLVGQHVYSGLYGGKYGCITVIHGEQRPQSCESIGRGVGVTGGNATIDIVWLNGQESLGIPESLLRRSVQWNTYASVASPEELAEALVFLAFEKRNRAAIGHAEQSAFERECIRLKGLDETRELVTAEVNSCSFKRAVVNIRKLLKKAWPKVKFSVRQSYYGSVHISWQDGPTVTQVDDKLVPFRGGHFDGMEDIYRHEVTAWNQLYGSADYINTSRSESESVLQKGIDTLWEAIPGNLADMSKPSVSDISVYGYHQKVPHLDCLVGECALYLASAFDATTGAFVKPRHINGLTFLIDRAVALQLTAVPA